MLGQKFIGLLTKAAEEAQRLGKLPPVALPEVEVERPQNPEHGDYASSLPLKLARLAKAAPMTIAHDIVQLLGDCPEIGSVAVAPPGFINFTLRSGWLVQQVDTILAAGEDYGNIEAGGGSRVQLEFVSVNPTGPVSYTHLRAHET